MAEYRVGHERTKARQQTSVMVNISLKRAVYDRLVQMQNALQREVGEAHKVTLPSMIRRILYAHPSLKPLVQRHYGPHHDEDGNSLVR